MLGARNQNPVVEEQFEPRAQPAIAALGDVTLKLVRPGLGGSSAFGGAGGGFANVPKGLPSVRFFTRFNAMLR